MLEHDCAGLQVQNNFVMACKCLSKDMYEQVIRYARNEFIGEVQAFANDYHHHFDGRDVVIVEQLLDFLRTPEGRDNDGVGQTR